MLSIKFIRENPKVIKEDLKKRNLSDKINLVDELLDKDERLRGLKQNIDELRRKRNIITEEINKLKKEGKDISNKLNQAKDIPLQIKKLEEDYAKLEERIRFILDTMPNITHKNVPYGLNATNNKVLRKWGEPKKNLLLMGHVELAEKLGIADFDAGREVAGQGFNYLKDELAVLDFALQKYAVDFLLKKGFELIVPPMMLNRETLSGTVVLSDFKDVIYKIENEDLYLIGTSEHSLVSMLKNKTLKKEDLPIKICAVTPCFRREIGGHGVDTKGLFRMHQFNKVEQIIFTTAEDSFKRLEEMQKITEDFFKTLKIPFRVVEICSGDLGMKFAKQYDIEAWFPRQNEYKEVTSAGNCTDYQAIPLNIKYSDKDEKKFMHILNNTMVATSRAMVAILENYQEKNGSVKIPNVLHKYTGFKKISLKSIKTKKK